MWLPTRIYESLPTVYIVIGLTFLGGSLYIGLEHRLGPMYFCLGVISVMSGLYVGQRRLYERRREQRSDDRN